MAQEAKTEKFTEKGYFFNRFIWLGQFEQGLPNRAFDGQCVGSWLQIAALNLK